MTDFLTRASRCVSVKMKVSQECRTDFRTRARAQDTTLPHIISKPLGIDCSVGEREAQLTQIERSIRLAIASTNRHKLVKWLLVKPKVLAQVRLARTQRSAQSMTREANPTFELEGGPPSPIQSPLSRSSAQNGTISLGQASSATNTSKDELLL